MTTLAINKMTVFARSGSAKGFLPPLAMAPSPDTASSATAGFILNTKTMSPIRMARMTIVVTMRPVSQYR